MSLLQWVDFPVLGDARGSLIALEANKGIPFEIKRVYYIFGTGSDVSRGYHAHINLRQIAVCVSGRCRMVLDDGSEKISIWLDSPAKGVLIESMTWREMHDFSSDCVLLVLASDYYEENDYIRSYSEFSNRVGV